MSEVLTGKGPQPPVVYWIRRGLVVLVAVIVVGLLVWAFLPKGEQPTTGVPAVWDVRSAHPFATTMPWSSGPAMTWMVGPRSKPPASRPFATTA